MENGQSFGKMLEFWPKIFLVLTRSRSVEIRLWFQLKEAKTLAPAPDLSDLFSFIWYLASAELCQTYGQKNHPTDPELMYWDHCPPFCYILGRYIVWFLVECLVIIKTDALNCLHGSLRKLNKSNPKSSLAINMITVVIFTKYFTFPIETK